MLHPVDKLLSHLFRTESGKMVSVLTRILGLTNHQLAEDVVQETLLTAMNGWKVKGIPDNPQAWLHTVAKRKAIDLLRQQKVRQSLHHDMANVLTSEWTLTPTVNHLFLEHEIEDSQLRMIFACCHPAIPYESQLALTLKTLCGLSVQEIAHAFLTNEEVIAKRIYRAREKIREENISLDVPVGKALDERLEAVWHTLYLLFNEGYHSAHADQLIREDLCAEAMRLCLLLTKDDKTNRPSSSALLALMCFQASREAARCDEKGDIVLLKDQDRSRWNASLITKGFEYLDLASADEVPGSYFLEASISATHSSARSFEQTNWKQIVLLYETLERIKPGPIVQLNKAIAIGYAKGRRAGLDALLAIHNLTDHTLYHTAVGDFYADLKETDKARQSYEKAITMTNSLREKELLKRKIESLQ